MRKQDLHDGLVRRYNAIAAARSQNIDSEMRYAADWIRKQPALMGLLQEARRTEEPPQVEDWLTECRKEFGIVWRTSTEEGRAALVWDFLTTAPPGQAESVALNVFMRSGEKRIDTMVNQLATEVFTPLFEWLLERVQRTCSVIHTLRRYVHRVETYDRDALHALFLERTATGEELYNDDLQKRLFDDGDYVTYAKVRSASGEPDLIGDLDSWDPIILDGKLYKAGKLKYVANGVRQVYEYAVDHGQHTGYLVVFNLTDHIVKIDGDGPAGTWPPYFEIAGVWVYVVVVRALPPETTASKRGIAKVVTLTRDLVEQAVAGDLDES
ncbi:hypothetical protein [Kitasatospora sp. NBC_01300]|uniref:hypothetical protein n=1 Tax=Kitasatospora sp. NBC_01300 TaxID=2903574 RepID=UPI002F9089B1|nr:hypothetical protein OG556_40790 [Kitasatospora sp. NBC_01300]